MTAPVDVAGALQAALYTRLSGAVYTSAGAAVSIFDSVPETPAPAYPYVVIGEDQVVADAAEGLPDSVDVTSTVHVFSNRMGRTEAKAIAGQVRRLVTGSALDLGPGWSLCDQLCTGSHVVEDEDGTTAHAIVTFKFLADPAE